MTTARQEASAQPRTPTTVALARLAELHPDRPAVTDAAHTVTRAELESRTNRLARAYAELGVTPGSFVTIALPNTVEFVEATIATWKTGATPQLISRRLPDSERSAILELASPSLVIGVDSSEGPAIPADYEPPLALSDEPLESVVSPSWKAPTSGGSTGRPKLIVSTDPAEADLLWSMAAALRMKTDGTHLATGPLYHNGPFFSAACALATGNHVVVMERFDPTRALELIEAFDVDWVYAVPTMMQRIWRLPDDVRSAFDLSSLRTVTHMAAPCPSWLKLAWIEWLGPERILELYGGTEGQATTLISGLEWLEHRGSVGRAAIGEVKVCDATGADLPPGKVGDIWLRRGPGEPATYRYIGATPRSRQGGWECLGDIGYLDADGYLYITDRDSDMILVGGVNVYPAEVEAALDEHPDVLSSCVIGLPHDDLGSVPHALVQLARSVSDDALLEHLATRVAKQKLPRSFERVDHALRDDAGKVRRTALRDERLAIESPS